MREVYRQYWRINLLTTLEYRTNFLLWFGFTIVYHGTAIAALWVMLTTFPSMNGWDFRNMAFLYGLWMTAHALNATFFSTVGEIPQWIRDGEFDRLLVRPLDELFQVISTPGAIFPDELLLALAFLVVAIAANHLAVTAGFVALIVLVVTGGALIDLSIALLISTVAFWFVQVDALRWIVLQLEQEFTRYPAEHLRQGRAAAAGVRDPVRIHELLSGVVLLAQDRQRLGPAARGRHAHAADRPRLPDRGLPVLAFRAAALPGRRSLTV